MFFFGSKKDKPKTHLVVSFEASSIKVCLVSRETHKPYIIAECVEKCKNMEISSVQKSLDRALVSLLKKQPAFVDGVMCVLGASWYYSRVNNYTRDEETPFLFKKSEIKKIMQNIISDSRTKAVEDMGVSEQDVELIEKNILHIGFNGYSVVNINRERVRRVDITSYVSFANKKILTMIEHEIHRHVKKDIMFQTSLLVNTVVARDTFPHLDNFMLVVVDSKHSEIGVASNDTLVSGTSFSVGDSVLDEKAVLYGFDPITLRSELRAFEKGALLSEESSKLTKIISESKEEWRQAFFENMETIARIHPLPKQVLVVAEPDSFVMLKKALEDSRNKHLTISETNLHAILINIEALHTLAGSKISEPDSKLMIYTAFTILKAQK